MLNPDRSPITMKTIPRLSAPMAAIEQLRALIQSGELRTGDRLPPERELVKMLGVSRPTVREALTALSLLNVIVSRQGSGHIIASPANLGELSPTWTAASIESLSFVDDVASVLALRSVLESGLARFAASRISDASLTQYKSILEQLRRAKNGTEVLHLDMKLHNLIAEASQSYALVSLLESLKERAALARSQTIRVQGVQEDVINDQDEIYSALCRRDESAAADAMWKHLQRIENAYVNHVIGEAQLVHTEK